MYRYVFRLISYLLFITLGASKVIAGPISSEMERYHELHISCLENIIPKIRQTDLPSKIMFGATDSDRFSKIRIKEAALPNEVEFLKEIIPSIMKCNQYQIEAWLVDPLGAKIADIEARYHDAVLDQYAAIAYDGATFGEANQIILDASKKYIQEMRTAKLEFQNQKIMKKEFQEIEQNRRSADQRRIMELYLLGEQVLRGSTVDDLPPAPAPQPRRPTQTICQNAGGNVICNTY